jgi:putative ABC transport system permease protein
MEYGLTYDDAQRIHDTLPTVKVVVPTREIRSEIRFYSRRVDGMVVGTLPWYPEVTGLIVKRGRYLSSIDVKGNQNVCVLGATLAENLFVAADPLGQIVRVKSHPYRVVGIMASRQATAGGESMIRDYDLDMYIPISAAKTRFGETIVRMSSGSFERETIQLHSLTLEVDSLDHVIATSEVVEDILARYHKKKDYDIIVPLELLRQAEETKRIFNIVLGSIAAISLLVGGIGIMNIMLATVTERTREIGIRRALGAKRRDIIAQFLSESIILSGFGGLVGLGLGVIIPFIVTASAGMRTKITPWSLCMALFISVAVGVIFGSYPANRAAQMDPIEALRHE